MEKVCPLCNGMKDINFLCNSCNSIMIDQGRVQDYSDAYSNQQEINDYINYCRHLFKCTKCNAIEIKSIHKVNI